MTGTGGHPCVGAEGDPTGGWDRGGCRGSEVPTPPGSAREGQGCGCSPACPITPTCQGTHFGNRAQQRVPLAVCTNTRGRTEPMLCWVINARGSVSGACFHLLTAPPSPACRGGWSWLLLTVSIHIRCRLFPRSPDCAAGLMG